MPDLFASSAVCLVGADLVIGFVFLANAIKIVPEYQRLVVFRLGRSIGPMGPGITLLIPIIDRAVRVDLREPVREVPHQTSITKDNAPISIDFLWYYKVLDPAESVLQVGNFESAAAGIAATTLRAVIGGIPLDDVLSEREHINNMRARILTEHLHPGNSPAAFCLANIFKSALAYLQAWHVNNRKRALAFSSSFASSR